ncbi:Asp-tRNA(Asn)/Glu-tRNA(Gln) amidotransferase A subunit family amidase [Roseinatronobacter thiooxidans]|uniref:Asp-tRNA(Asn)/Glu-tRNA(Gln) amidotransferase A subunit family amidase n=1 Tax=Roseinatronobacter thiooxidans TaxID=121821 RepID=A0A2W7PZ74_9RHOB|nr:amidase [Roseinatronobacter thiooxidans]PZX40726.1 Asp-tRNA(Asn)/Glu-tRNA(Gln) amidotransferase A subunit family amidase [Roseinatronobacter thiooxidans]
MGANSPTATRRPERIIGLDAVTTRDRLGNGILRATDVAAAYLAQVRAREDDVQAFVCLDEGHVMTQAERLDDMRKAGLPTGPLFGVPVALKDVIDTKGIPTENGTVIDAGRVPSADATVVRKLKAAGAVIMGKTVTTELAFLQPGKTRNPVNPAHTPGGSSQGSAAAVGAGMVPLAVGTQTGGSVIRPAAYCGVVGYKPSFGAISRSGILMQSPTLDTVGVFSTTVEGAAMLADALFGDDPSDPATTPSAPPALLATALSKVPVRPALAIVSTMPGGVPASEDMTLAMEELTGILGEDSFPLILPPMFDEAAEIRERINFAEMAKCYYSYERRGRDQLSAVTLDAIDQGKAILARDYLAALDWPKLLNTALDEIFMRCDAIICPATPTSAPEGLSSTGSAIYNGVWTLCGVPAVTLPVFEDSNGMPMGLQLVGRRGNDARLLRTARWLMNEIKSASGEMTDG